MARRMKSLLAARSGSVALEYGIVAPALLVMMLGIMDVGRLMWSYTTLHRAVEAAARCGAVNETLCSSSSQVVSYAASETWGLSVQEGTFSVSEEACGQQVAAEYNVTLFMPWLWAETDPWPNSITLTTSACYPRLY